MKECSSAMEVMMYLARPAWRVEPCGAGWALVGDSFRVENLSKLSAESLARAHSLEVERYADKLQIVLTVFESAPEIVLCNPMHGEAEHGVFSAWTTNLFGQLGRVFRRIAANEPERARAARN